MKSVFWLGLVWIWILFALWLLSGIAEQYVPAIESLSWIPSTFWLVLIIFGAVAVEASLHLRATHRVLRLVGVLLPIVVLLGSAIFYDWRPSFGSEPSTGDGVLKIAFINASNPQSRSQDQMATKLLGLDADVLVVVDPGGLSSALRSGLRETQDSRVQGNTFRLAVISALTIDRMKMLFAADGMTGLRLHLEQKSGLPFRILVVDLPSHPKIPRVELAHALQELIKETGASDFDVMVGDFNLTPGSRSLDIASGGFRNAFEHAGSGWGGTWPGSKALLRIDHAFVADDVELLDARTFDVGGDHRGIIITLKADDRGISP